MARDSSGNFYAGGEYSDSPSFGSLTLPNALSTDAYLIKYDASGTPLWVEEGRAGGNADNNDTEITPDGDIVTVGSFENTITFGGIQATSAGGSDAFIIKLDENGNGIWASSGGGSANDAAVALAVASSGNIYLTGNFNDTATFGSDNISDAGSQDIFISKLNSDGDFQWTKAITNSVFSDRVTEITIDNDENIYITGDYQGTAVFGDSTVTSEGSGDIFIAKYDTNGDFIWVRSFGDTGNDGGRAITYGSDGNLYITGYVRNNVQIGTVTIVPNGNVDIFIAKIDTDGAVLDVNSFGSGSQDVPSRIAVNSENEVFVLGTFRSAANFGLVTTTAYGSEDIFIVKYDSDLEFVWATTNGSAGIDLAGGLALDNSDNAYFLGSFVGTASFSAQTLTSSGGYDMVFGKVGVIRPIGITASASIIGPFSVVVNANITDEANSPVIEKGFVWSTNPTPDISLNTKIISNTSSLSFTEEIEGLENNTRYYIRAYATNSEGTTYSNELEVFTRFYPIEIDGNQDGVLDAGQDHVTTVYNEFTKNYLTVVSTNEFLISDVFIRASNDPDYLYPYGQIEFKSAGGVDLVKVYFHGLDDLSLFDYRKKDSKGKYYTFPLAQSTRELVGTDTVAIELLQLTDGGQGDFDGEMNGVIYDPGGPAILNVNATIPVWDWWWVLLLLGGGWVAYKAIK